VWLPAYALFDVEVGPMTTIGAGNAFHLAFADPAEGGAEGNAQPLFQWSRHTVGPLTLQLARAVFAEPDAPWSRPHAAAAWNLSEQRISAQMLREGSSLSEVIREQRLMRALLAIAQADSYRSVSNAFGFSSLERLYAAFFDRFGTCAEQLCALRWHCAMSWSGMPDMRGGEEAGPGERIHRQFPWSSATPDVGHGTRHDGHV
jgi:AraC-like DNA-binding protein